MHRSKTFRLMIPPVAFFALLIAGGCATTPQPAVAPMSGQSEATTPQPDTAPVLASSTSSSTPATPSAPTPDEARKFVETAEARLLELGIAASRAAWVQANFITDDTQAISAAANEQIITEGVRYAKQATRFDSVEVPADVRRKLNLLKLSLTSPAPGDPEKTKELATIAARLEATYGSGKYCPPGKSGDDCLDIGEITKVFTTSRNPKQLLEVWQGWRTISKPMRPDYQRFVELMNEGSTELGFPDTGALWRSKYDMPPDAFAAEMDRLWLQMKPLYDSLHCYVRSKLVKKYGTSVVPPNGPIPAHLLGNIWAQDWSNIYELVAPPNADPGYDLTKQIVKKKLDAKAMVRMGEGFFTSLGFDPLPQSFWERSLFTQPKDRQVVCHASAWDIDAIDDLRIKMCIEPNAEDFRTIHHELGHNFYQRAYNKQPNLFRDSANDGFHEAIGDTIALSVTPSYLKQVGLIDKEPDASADIGLLMKDALEGIAFLPWGLLVDKWRWQVFSGEISPAEYNAGWWKLREQYQGVAAPIARTEQDFDPGAKYHIPGNTPYARYFLARILQYQLHRSLCQTAGYKGALNRCSIYGNKEAGAKLKQLLEMGVSRPWPDALEAATGQRQMDATAILDYYAPLQKWLDQQNKGRECGW